MSASRTPSLFDLDDRAVLVTGAAQGLGFAMARGLIAHGAKVAVLDQDGQAAEAAARELASGGGATLALAADVTHEAEVEAAIARVVSEWGQVHVLVNNAGIALLGPAETTPLNDFKHVYDIDVFGLFGVAKAVYGPMAEAGGGSIINIASMAGITVLRPQEHVAYNSAKAAVIMVTKSLAVEWAPANIRVNAIAPGYMMTPPVALLRDEDPERWRYWMSQVPLERVGDPSELQGAVIYLASDASSYVTGSVLVVDGGYSCA